MQMGGLCAFEKETMMNATPVLAFDTPNWAATDPLPRDQTQSHRLHEPEQMISTIDPITGKEIDNLEGHPYLVDGNVVIYFESEATRKAFQEMPTDHPFRLQDNPLDEGEAEG